MTGPPPATGWTSAQWQPAVDLAIAAQAIVMPVPLRQANGAFCANGLPVVSPLTQMPLLISKERVLCSVPDVVPEQGDPWNAPPWLVADKQQERRSELGLDEARVNSFAGGCEFVSLGSFCGAAFALQGLGLKKFAYPFDWNRSPVEGVVHCMENDFADFLTYSFSRPEANHSTLYGGSRWGGSFWHHDPDDPRVRLDFRRRADRLLGRGTDVSTTAPRVFVRHANSSQELRATLALHDALRRALPSADVYLLVIIDFQQGYRPLDVRGAEKLLFYQVPESIFADPSKHFAAQMQLSVQAYTQAIAFALHLWAGNLESRSKTLQVQSLDDLERLCQPFHGGDPSTMLFVPKRVSGTGLSL